MRIVWLIYLIFGVLAAQAQNITLKNRVIDAKGGSGIAYVNIGLVGKNLGTVSNEQGHFTLELPENALEDTVLFSCIGYEQVKVPVPLLRDWHMPVLMTRKIAQLPEVKVAAKRTKEQFFGHFTESPVVQAGFNQNILGKECGVLMRTKKPALLDQVQINFGKCTYDSVYFRLNVYQKTPEGNFENILTQPIFLAYSHVELDETLAIDVRPYQIEVNGEFMVSVEYIRDMGAGTLYFKSKLNKKTYIRSTSQANWVETSVGVSIGVFAHVER